MRILGQSALVELQSPVRSLHRNPTGFWIGRTDRSLLRHQVYKPDISNGLRSVGGDLTKLSCAATGSLGEGDTNMSKSGKPSGTGSGSDVSFDLVPQVILHTIAREQLIFEVCP